MSRQKSNFDNIPNNYRKSCEEVKEVIGRPRTGLLVKEQRKSFVGRRIQQSLRHLSTVLYYVGKKISPQLKEVQLMYVVYSLPPVTRLFVAASPMFDDVYKKLKSVFNDKLDKLLQYQAILSLLKSTEPSIHYGSYEKCRFRRVNEKIWKVLKKKEDEMTSGTDVGNRYIIAKKIFDHDRIVLNNSYHVKHAEEVLCDRAEQIKQSNPNVEIYIFGKRRPCLSCYSRLQMVLGEDNERCYFNPNNGYFYRQSLSWQSSKVARNTRTLMATRNMHITRRSVENWDSESNSDA